jgi:hypothetical protein
MYLPDPVFALVLSYLTDGRPARRVLAGCRVGRTVVEGWQATHRGRRSDDLQSVIRYALDIAAYMVHSENKGTRGALHFWYRYLNVPARYIALIVKPEAIERMAKFLMGTWRHPPFVHIPAFGIANARLVYDYSPCLIVAEIISPDEYVKCRDHYEYFIFWDGTSANSTEDALQINKDVHAGFGRVL